MIKNKELGVEIAENPEERMWVNAFEQENRILGQLKANLNIIKEDMKKKDREIIKNLRDQMKEEKKKTELNIKFHKELVKFFSSKLDK